MSLSIEFNEKDYKATKNSDYVLAVTCAGSTFCYDFAARVMYGWGRNSGSYGMTPFSQLDRETLVTMRDKLVDLGGKPPELSPEAPATQASSRKFNL
jgi:hypothetical protein